MRPEARTRWCADPRALAWAYLLAKERVIAAGFEDEIAWQESVALQKVTPSTFVREAAWVVLCAGMREKVVRAKFGEIGRAFAHWDPSRIVRGRAACKRRALAVFNHDAKLNAIVDIAAEVIRDGLEDIIRALESSGPSYLTRFPYIGPITCFHLAKNLGCPVAKPDRHLERMATALGYVGAAGLCSAIAEVLDEPIQVVDVVMWRYATIDRHYVAWLRDRAIQAAGGWRTPAQAECLS